MVRIIKNYSKTLCEDDRDIKEIINQGLKIECASECFYYLSLITVHDVKI